MDVLLLILRVLLAVLLYAFLAAIFAMVWRDMRQAAINRESLRPSGQLTVLQTADEAIKVGTTFALQLVTSIGRLPSNTITISDTYASSRHALLSWKEEQWWLEDQGSRNGTLLNETRIVDPTIVSTGDVISIGHTKLKLELE
jgi:pSer/pThr/pTyr-binding forkhead associated (FHA) protein